MADIPTRTPTTPDSNSAHARIATMALSNQGSDCPASSGVGAPPTCNWFPSACVTLPTLDQYLEFWSLRPSIQLHLSPDQHLHYFPPTKFIMSLLSFPRLLLILPLLRRGIIMVAMWKEGVVEEGRAERAETEVDV